MHGKQPAASPSTPWPSLLLLRGRRIRPVRPSASTARLLTADFSAQSLHLLEELIQLHFQLAHPLVAVGYMDGALRVWNYQTEQLLAEFTDQHSRVWIATFSPDDSF